MDSKIAVARCHEIQLAIKDKEVSKFEAITEIGMAVQLALHIKGLSTIDFEILKLVASTMLGIPRIAVKRIVELLAEVEFVRIYSVDNKIKSIVPVIPFFDGLYEGIGEYLSNQATPDEFEKLTLAIVDRLAGSPYNQDTLADHLGADRKSFNDSIEIGNKGGFLITRRARAKNIILNPSYFSENADIFIDHAAKNGAVGIKRTIELIQKSQGWPLSIIESTMSINGESISADDLNLLKKLAQDGAIKPPKITTSHKGENIFIFTPTPGMTKLNPLNREIYEKALAIVSAVRQGQLLPNHFKIRNPAALLYRLKSDLQLRPTSDYAEQYKNLVSYRVAKLERLTNGYTQLKIIDTPENREALNIAYRMVQGSYAPELGLDSEAQKAMTSSNEYVESLISSRKMREKETITLSDEKAFEYEQMLLEGI